MFCGFQGNAFQSNGYQILKNPDWLGGGDYYYLTPYQAKILEDEKREKIKADKQDLVLVEKQITKSVDKFEQIKSKQDKEILELQEERLLYQQISQLRIMRVELIRRIQENEAFLIILITMKRRKLRAV